MPKNSFVVAEIIYRGQLVASLTFGGNSPSYGRLVDAVVSGDPSEAARLVRRHCPDRTIFPSGGGRLSADWLIVCRLEP